MNSQTMPVASGTAGEALDESYRRTRAFTSELCNALEIEDFVGQSMPDASPAKWHLAHTTWFFETFLLQPLVPGYRVFHEDFHYLFNSYYYSVGEMHRRPERGLLSRPTVTEVLAYREYVDEHMLRLLGDPDNQREVLRRTTLGLHHEQQHQELILTDIKHLLSLNPLKPAFREDLAVFAGAADQSGRLGYHGYAAGLYRIGFEGKGFCFDNETPSHQRYQESFSLADRLVTNAEFRRFIEDGGYATPTLWLSDGWARVQQQGWQHPIYWTDDLDSEFTLGGMRRIDADAPVCHVSYFEADAFARWAGARLPTEAEWEIAAGNQPVEGNFVESGLFHPAPAPASTNNPLRQLYGDVWEWTASPYAAYPGYRPPDGALGEYNGKFMCNQLVLRGGSCATSVSHIRPSYRNFFYPDARWQFSGIRLAAQAVTL